MIVTIGCTGCSDIRPIILKLTFTNQSTSGYMLWKLFVITSKQHSTSCSVRFSGHIPSERLTCMLYDPRCHGWSPSWIAWDCLDRCANHGFAYTGYLKVCTWTDHCMVLSWIRRQGVWLQMKPARLRSQARVSSTGWLWQWCMTTSADRHEHHSRDYDTPFWTAPVLHGDSSIIVRSKK